MQTGDARVLMQLNPMKDVLEKVNEPLAMLEMLGLYSGFSKETLAQDLKSKENILRWIVKNNVNDVNKIGLLMSKYYLSKILTKQKGA